MKNYGITLIRGNYATSGRQNYFYFSNCERLDILVNKEPPAKRHNSKIGIDQLKYDIQQIQSSFSAIQSKQREWERREQDRNDLLHTRYRDLQNLNMLNHRYKVGI